MDGQKNEKRDSMQGCYKGPTPVPTLSGKSADRCTGVGFVSVKCGQNWHVILDGSCREKAVSCDFMQLARL